MAEMLEVRLEKPYAEKHQETTSTRLMYPRQLHFFLLEHLFFEQVMITKW